MIWSGADTIIIEIKCTVNVMCLNQPKTTHPQSIFGKVIFRETGRLWHRMLRATGLTYHGLRTARVLMQPHCCSSWDSFNGQLWPKDCHQPNLNFSDCAAVWSAGYSILSFPFPSLVSGLCHSFRLSRHPLFPFIFHRYSTSKSLACYYGLNCVPSQNLLEL